jgi:DNA polymerase elongation subunit (family B)
MFKKIYYDNKKKSIYLCETYNGKEVESYEPFEYRYYVPDGEKKSPIRDIHNNPVVLQKTKDKSRFKFLKEKGLPLYESDLNEEIQYLQHRYRDVDLKPDFKDFRIAYLDIEVESEFEFPKPEECKYPINLITVYDSKTEQYYTWGIRPYTGNDPMVQNYFYFADETEMLTDFIKWFSDQEFDILTGWYVKDFDVHYILNRKEKLGIQENLTKLNNYYHNVREVLHTDSKTGKIMKRKVYYCRIAGLSILCSLELYQKFTFKPLESYTLNFVAHHLGLPGKIELEGHVNNEWKNNWNRFVIYNVQDVKLVKEIDDIKKHIALAIQFASEALIPIDRVFSSIATVEGYILKDLHKNNLVMSDRKKCSADIWKKLKLYKHNGHIQNLKDGTKEFDDFYVKGGHVEATPGLYHNVLSFDVTSLYPHNIIQYNVSPETKVFNPSPERIAQGDLIRTPVNGIYYLKNKKGIVPQVVEKVFNERKEFKKLKFKYLNDDNKELGDYYDSQQHIRKIIINIAYGILVNKYSHFYDVDNARVITRAGRTIIRFLSETTNRYIKECWHKIAHVHFPGLKEYPKIKNDIVPLLDTDSVEGKSVLNTTNGDITIESLFDKADNIIQCRKEYYVGNFNNSIEALSFNINNHCVETKKIKYITKHKVKKGMYKIRVNGDETIITEDHSIIIERNGEFLNVSPKHIRKNDSVINICGHRFTEKYNNELYPNMQIMRKNNI